MQVAIGLVTLALVLWPTVFVHHLRCKQSRVFVGDKAASTPLILSLSCWRSQLVREPHGSCWLSRTERGSCCLHRMACSIQA